MRSIGLDVGRQFAEAAAIEPGGEVHRLGRITASPAGLRAFAAGLGPNCLLYTSPSPRDS